MSDNILGSQAFIDSIQAEIDKGIGFIPLIGSGVSCPSGIMTGAQFNDYLCYVIYNILKPVSDNETYFLDVKKYGWPEIPKGEHLEEAKIWIAKKYYEIFSSYNIDHHNNYLKIFNNPPKSPSFFPDNEHTNEESFDYSKNIYTELFQQRPGASGTSTQYLVEAGIRSLFDWKAMLQFVSRIKINNENIALSKNSDQSVIDSFNIFVTRGKKPNLSHYVMAYLTHALSIRTFITTNFDTLIEDTFDYIKKPLDVYSVEKNSSLPDPDAVSARMSLLKIHGSLHETRADYSLDLPPSIEDKNIFKEYFFPLEQESVKGLQCHLIIMGSSLGDNRTVEMIKHVIDHSKDFKIYYIGRNKKSVIKIKKVFEKHYFTNTQNNFIFTSAERLDLLLLDTYQKIARSLPPGGFTHQFTQLSPPRWVNNSKKTSQIYLSDIHKFKENQEKYGEGSIHIISGKGHATHRTQTIYESIKEKDNRIWLELDNFKDPFSLLSEIFKIILIRKGLFYLEHVVIDFDSIHEKYLKTIKKEKDKNIALKSAMREIRSTIKLLKFYFGNEDEKWYIFLYGRTLPGYCVGWNGGQEWREDNYDLLWKIIHCLSENKFNIIYAPFENNPEEPSKSKFVDNTNFELEKNTYILKNDSKPFDKTIIKSIYSEQESQGKENIFYLYALCLFRESRNPSVFLSYPTFLYTHISEYFESPKNREEHKKKIQKINKELYIKDIFFEKLGGYYWMHRDDRDSLIEIIENDKKNYKKRKSEIHFWIGEWYLRAFYATNHSDPLIESIYHKIESLKYLQQETNATKIKTNKTISTISSIIKTLIISRNSFRFWIYGSQGKHIFIEDFFEKFFFDNKIIEEEKLGTFITRDRKIKISKKYLEEKSGIKIKKENEEIKIYITDLIINLINEYKSLRVDIKKESNFFNIGGNEFYYGESKIGENRSPLYYKHNVNKLYPFIKKTVWEENFKNNSNTKASCLFIDNKKIHNFLKNLLNFNYKFTSSNLKKEMHEIIFYYQTQPRAYLNFVQLLSNITYSAIMRCRYLERYISILNWDNHQNQTQQKKIELKKEKKDLKKYWGNVRLYSAIGLELLHNLNPDFIQKEHQLKCQFLCFQSISLAEIKFLTEGENIESRKNTHLDSQSLLDQAGAIAFNLTIKDSQNERAIIRLRKAEIYILEAESLKQEILSIKNRVKGHEFKTNKNHKNETKELLSRIQKLYKHHIIKLDDASFLLDDAEHLLSGHSHSSLWWGRLYYSRLKIYSSLYITNERQYLSEEYLPLFLRKKVQYDSHILMMLKKSILISNNDTYAILCFIDIYLKAVKKIYLHLKRSLSKKQIDNYVENILRETKTILGAGKMEKGKEKNFDWQELLPHYYNGSENDDTENNELASDIDKFRSYLVNIILDAENQHKEYMSETQGDA